MLEFESPTWGREKVPMKYSPEQREAILAKLEAPYNRTVNDLAGEEGISAATIYNWRKQARSTGRLLPNASPTTEGWGPRLGGNQEKSPSATIRRCPAALPSK